MPKENRLAEFLGTQSRDFTHLVSQVARSPTGEALHRLRRTTRRIRASLWVLRHSSARIRSNALERHLKRLGKSLGKVRELDVAIADAGRFGFDSLELKKRRSAAKRELQKLTGMENGEKLGRELVACQDRVKPNMPPSLRRVRRIIRARLKAELEKRVRGQRSLHRLRISLRKALYQMEAMGSGNSKIRRLQNKLGKAHDLEFLQSQLGKNPKLKSRQKALSRKCLSSVRRALKSGIRQMRHA